MSRNLSKKQSTIVKRSLRFSTKPLFLDSTIPIYELIVETFYCIRTFELYNIWVLHRWHTHNHNQNFQLTSRTSWGLSSQQQVYDGCYGFNFFTKQTSNLLWNFSIWWIWENLVTKTLTAQRVFLSLKTLPIYVL